MAWLNLRFPLLGVILLLFLRVSAFAGPPDPLVLPYTESSVHRLALSLGRQTRMISREEGKTIVDALEKQKAPPESVLKRWNRLLRLSQMLTYLQGQEVFFPTGYEFEVYNPGKNAYFEFKKGFKEYRNLIAKHFGAIGNYYLEPTSNLEQMIEDGKIIDSRERVWSVTTEYLRKSDWEYPSGWEIGSPPFRKPEELQLLVGMLLDLSGSDYGESNSMSSVHQTYTIIPPGTSADTKLVARTAANFLLLQQQFLPVIYEVIDSRRGGGPLNFFMSPLVFEHYELIRDIAALDPKSMTLEDLHRLMHDKYALKEFQYQLDHQFPANSKEAVIREIREERLGFPDYEKKAFYQNWKYRDSQLKFNLAVPSQTLIEVRIGDWKTKSMENNILQTMIYQNLIGTAHDLALKGKLWNLELPKPVKGEKFLSYWNRLKKAPASSPQSFLDAIGIAKNPNLSALVLGKPFAIENPRMQAGKRISYGFEIEGMGNGLVEVILPRDPDLRKDWRWYNYEKKAKFLKQMGFPFEGEYSLDLYRILTSEFYADFERFPYLHHELHLEASGNWEIKSSGKDLGGLAKTSKALNEAMDVMEDGFGIHAHTFLPDAVLKSSGVLGKGAPNAKKLAYQLYQRSFLLQIEGYEWLGDAEKNHYLDSWSLDRLAPADIERFLRWTEGKEALDATQLKYHNFGIRPVPGGLDIEARDNDDDTRAAMKVLEDLDRMFATGDFGKVEWGEHAPLFMEFTDHPGLRGVERYTLEGALSTRYKLTPQQRKIAHLLQFEIYKPAMGEYVFFEGFSGLQETPDELLDPARVRSNFENNVAIPLLNYEEQPFLTVDQMRALEKSRHSFLGRVHKLVLEIESNPRKYKFLLENDDFLHLCQYLERSKHPNKPSFAKRPGMEEAKRQRKALEELVFRLRKDVMGFLDDSKLVALTKASFEPGFKLPGPPVKKGYKPDLKFPLEPKDCFGPSLLSIR